MPALAAASICASLKPSRTHQNGARRRRTRPSRRSRRSRTDARTVRRSAWERAVSGVRLSRAIGEDGDHLVLRQYGFELGDAKLHATDRVRAVHLLAKLVLG